MPQIFYMMLLPNSNDQDVTHSTILIGTRDNFNKTIDCIGCKQKMR